MNRNTDMCVYVDTYAYIHYTYTYIYTDTCADMCRRHVPVIYIKNIYMYIYMCVCVC